MIKPVLFAGALACASFAADRAFAHAALAHAQPSVGSAVKSPPKDVTLKFSEGVVPRLSGIKIQDAAGNPVKTGRAASGGAPATLVVPIAGRLAPGTYTVTWHAVSVDSHRTQGSFRFTVSP